MTVLTKGSVMSRIAIPARDDAPEASREMLTAVHSRMRVVPNLFRLMSLSPAVLRSFTDMSAALEQTLDIKTRMRIAVTVSQVDGCDYCLSINSYVAMNVARLTPQEVELNRRGKSGDPRAEVVVRFAKRTAESRGKVDDDAIAEVRSAGYGDAEIVEMIALVAQTMFTNLLTNASQADVDFPKIEAAGGPQ